MENSKLYVGSLNYDTTEDALEKFFSQVGKVDSATVIIDKTTGNSKGFGFVEMASEGEAEKAIQELDGKELDGRNIKVDKAKPMQKKSFGQFSEGGGGFNRSRY